METQSCADVAAHTIYDDEVFQMACEQFRVIADYLNIDQSDREWATYPKRAVAFDGRHGGAGDVDELEMRAGAVALRRRERGRGG